MPPVRAAVSVVRLFQALGLRQAQHQVHALDGRAGRALAQIIKKGGKEAILEAIGGPVCQTGFQRLIK